MTELSSDGQRELAAHAIRLLAVLDRNRQMVEIGAYEKGSNLELDRALSVADALNAWLRQSRGGVARSVALQELQDILRPAAAKAPP